MIFLSEGWEALITRKFSVRNDVNPQVIVSGQV